MICFSKFIGIGNAPIQNLCRAFIGSDSEACKSIALGTVRKFPHLPKYGHARILLRPPLPPQNTGKLGNCLNVTDTCSCVNKKGKVKV